MKKFFKQLHLWLSVPFGLLISVICFSGATLVFENEITRALHPDLYYVKQVGDKPLPLDKLLEKASAALPDSVAITGVSISDDPHRAYQVNLSKPRRASLCIDQYTGEVKGRAERSPFFLKMFLLHRFLLDSMKPGEGVFWGKLIVGISTLMAVVVLISGIVIWVPRTVKALKNRLKVNVGRGWPRFWYDLHVSAGFYVAIILLVVALTGLTWSFSWYRNGFYALFGAKMEQRGDSSHRDSGGKAEKGKQAGKPQAGEAGRDIRKKGRPESDAQRETHGQGAESKSDRGNHLRQEAPNRGEALATESDEKAPEPFAHWQEVFDALRRQNPDYSQITVGDGTASVATRGFGNQRAADRYTFNTASGQITDATLYKDSNRAGKLRGWILSLHVGSWGGMFTRICTFLAALIGGTLPLTGYYLWIKRLLRKRKKKGARA